MFLVMAFLNGILWAFLRRIYGGALESFSIIKERGVQTTLMIVSTLIVIFPSATDLNITSSVIANFTLSLLLSCWLQFCYWSLGHGMVMWIGTDGTPKDEKELKRYQDMWGYDFVCKIVPKENWYGPFFDWLLMKIRYVLPMIPMMIIHPLYLLIGWLVGNNYALCHKAFQEDKWIWNTLPKWLKTKWVGGPTSAAEFISGFQFGFIIYIIHRVLLING